MTEETMKKDYTAAKMGMWLFLATEFFLFVGPFLLYAAYRYRYATDFVEASKELDIFLGTFNTVVLLTSSLTMAMSIGASRRGNRLLTVLLLFSTALLGAVFLVNKYFEWSAKISHGIYPGSPALLEHGGGGAVFWGIYFFMTGIHALHVIAGVALLSVVALIAAGGGIDGEGRVRIENSGLYWHLVDVIWVYIFQTFYIVG